MLTNMKYGIASFYHVKSWNFWGITDGFIYLFCFWCRTFCMSGVALITSTESYFHMSYIQLNFKSLSLLKDEYLVQKSFPACAGSGQCCCVSLSVCVLLFSHTPIAVWSGNHWGSLRNLPISVTQWAGRYPQRSLGLLGIERPKIYSAVQINWKALWELLKH